MCIYFKQEPLRGEVMKLTPIHFLSAKEVRDFMERIIKDQIIKVTEVNGIVKIDQSQIVKLESHLLISNAGHTYLLEDVMEASDIYEEIYFPQTNRELVHIRDLQLNRNLCSLLIHNKPLAEALCRTNLSKKLLNTQIPQCAIGRSVPIRPVLTPAGNNFEAYAIIRWLMMNSHDPINQLPLSISDLIPNKALLQLTLVNLKQMIEAESILKRRKRFEDAEIFRNTIKEYKSKFESIQDIKNAIIKELNQPNFMYAINPQQSMINLKKLKNIFKWVDHHSNFIDNGIKVAIHLLFFMSILTVLVPLTVTGSYPGFNRRVAVDRLQPLLTLLAPVLAVENDVELMMSFTLCLASYFMFQNALSPLINHEYAKFPLMNIKYAIKNKKIMDMCIAEEQEIAKIINKITKWEDFFSKKNEQVVTTSYGALTLFNNNRIREHFIADEENKVDTEVKKSLAWNSSTK